MSPSLGLMSGATVTCIKRHLKSLILGGGARMGETVVYGGVEGGGTHSTVMIFDKVNI